MIKNYKLLLLIPVLCLFAASVNAAEDETEDETIDVEGSDTSG